MIGAVRSTRPVPLLPPEAYLPPLDVRPLEFLGCKFGVRPFNERDRGFIAATWGRTYRRLSRVPDIIFAREHPKVIDRCLAASRGVVVCSPEVPSTIYAWALGIPGEKPVLHYAYTVPELRNLGVARTLIGEVLGDYAPRIVTSHRWPPRGGRAHARFVFNPYRVGVGA
jgi:hypothetical protein